MQRRTAKKPPISAVTPEQAKQVLDEAAKKNLENGNKEIHEVLTRRGLMLRCGVFLKTPNGPLFVPQEQLVGDAIILIPQIVPKPAGAQ